MVLRVYLSLTSGNKEIKRQQDSIKQVLNCKKIEFEEVDISDSTLEDEKQFMRQHAKAKEGANVPLPPQVFNGQDYLGDYDDFLNANECDQLDEFLHLAPTQSKSEAAITLAENGGED